MKKEKVQNHKGEIVEVEVISEEESKILMEQSLPKVKITESSSIEDAISRLSMIKNE